MIVGDREQGLWRKIRTLNVVWTDKRRLDYTIAPRILPPTSIVLSCGTNTDTDRREYMASSDTVQTLRNADPEAVLIQVARFPLGAFTHPAGRRELLGFHGL